MESGFEYQITNSNFTMLPKIVKKYRIPNKGMPIQGLKPNLILNSEF
ncbi:hypothetical protein HJ01_01403 [Flavobacterium frigoris PS1]|uniref:Uncharacterized protein n=1 Tax=Flavobacterium frigoris (strain PS1) TaxID=1086011 RepID=H7FQE3_FLAFP|nr:hypothetical protein HJ01_01403 [Flavobacterium frigoris PS1]